VTPERAHQRAGWLRHAAILFVVLVAIAIALYADGYGLAEHYLSELGAITTWTGRPNHASAILFGLALAGLGGGLVAFAGTWRAFAFGRARARAAGIGAELFGTTSGVAFVAVAATPIDHALHAHNTLVVVAFVLLLGYAASLTIVAWQNGAARAYVAASVAYLVLVVGYFATVAVALDLGIGTRRGHAIMVISQKLFVALSILYVVFVTSSTRRMSSCVSPDGAAAR
jgi:hypothetical protein